MGLFENIFGFNEDKFRRKYWKEWYFGIESDTRIEYAEVKEQAPSEKRTIKLEILEEIIKNQDSNSAFRERERAKAVNAQEKKEKRKRNIKRLEDRLRSFDSQALNMYCMRKRSEAYEYRYSTDLFECCKDAIDYYSSLMLRRSTGEFQYTGYHRYSDARGAQYTYSQNAYDPGTSNYAYDFNDNGHSSESEKHEKRQRNIAKLEEILKGYNTDDLDEYLKLKRINALAFEDYDSNLFENHTKAYLYYMDVKNRRASGMFPYVDTGRYNNNTHSRHNYEEWFNFNMGGDTGPSGTAGAYENKQREPFVSREHKLYIVIGCVFSDDVVVIKKAYRLKVQELHPDKYHTAQDKERARKAFLVVQEAYDEIKKIRCIK